MSIKYYTREQIESMVKVQLINAFDDAIAAETKAYIKGDVPPQLTNQINLIRDEILKRMIV